ncbi:MAG: hypothetical protein MK227_03320 [Nitrososphaerales archaeon]|nr:hypothetical protein [Nitrososphaerales archaeon]
MPKFQGRNIPIFWIVAVLVVIGVAYTINNDSTLRGETFDEDELIFDEDFGNLNSDDQGITVFDDIDEVAHVPPSPGQLVPPIIGMEVMSWVDIRKTNVWIEDEWLWVKITVVNPPPTQLARTLPVPEGALFQLTDELLTWRVRIDVNNDNVTDYTIDAVWNPTGGNADMEGNPKDDLSGGYFRAAGTPAQPNGYNLGNEDFPGLIGTRENSLVTGFPLELLPLLGTEFEIAVCVNYTGDHEILDDFILAAYDCYPAIFPPGNEWAQIKL